MKLRENFGTTESKENIHVEPMPPQWRIKEEPEEPIDDRYFTREEWDKIYTSMLKSSVVALIVGVATAVAVVEIMFRLIGTALIGDL